MEDYRKYIEPGVNAAIIAGNEILKIYNNPSADFSIEKKADNSPLTIADKASHTSILENLQAFGLPVLSEEGNEFDYSIRKKWKLFWMVDPLDGTKEFIKRNDEFTVNIALIKNNKPVLGVIYIPVVKTLYFGAENFGAYKIDKIDSPQTLKEMLVLAHKLPLINSLSKFTIAGSRSHMNEETKNYIHSLEKKYQTVDIISKGSSLKICLIAEGLAHEYPRFAPTMEWDTAAGHAIVNAVGKKIVKTDFLNELEYNKENLINPSFIVK